MLAPYALDPRRRTDGYAQSLLRPIARAIGSAPTISAAISGRADLRCPHIAVDRTHLRYCRGGIGTTVGLAAGYFGGWIDLVLMRIADVFLGFPAIVLALAIVAVLGPGMVNVAVAHHRRRLDGICPGGAGHDAGAARAELRAGRARHSAPSQPRILFKEILPNALGPIIVLASLWLGTAIISESALSFLGFGLPPPTPTWGWTLAYGTRFMRDEPWLAIISGATIMVTVLGFNLLGDGLRDVLDPRHLSSGAENSGSRSLRKTPERKQRMVKSIQQASP